MTDAERIAELEKEAAWSQRSARRWEAAWRAALDSWSKACRTVKQLRRERDSAEAEIAKMVALGRRWRRRCLWERADLLVGGLIQGCDDLKRERDTALAEAARLRELLCRAAPLTWVATDDQAGAVAWEKDVEAELKRVREG